EVPHHPSAARPAPAQRSRDSASLGGTATRGDTTKPAGAAAGNTMTTPDGRTIQLPPGVTEAMVRSAFQKGRSGQQLTPAEQNAMTAMRAAFQRGGGGGGGGGAGGGMRRGGDVSSYIVFALRKGQPTPVQIRTALSDLADIEVLSGLTDQAPVVV